MKSEEDYKQEFIDYSSAGFLLKVWKQNQRNVRMVMSEVEDDNGNLIDFVKHYYGFVGLLNPRWKPDSKAPHYFTWPAEDFLKILNEKRKLLNKKRIF